MDEGAERRTSPPLRIGHTATGVIDTLGPGRRTVVWVQGCHIRCPGCIVPESWNERTGRLVDPSALAAELLDADPGDLTVSGGEPTEQASAVAVLLLAARQRGRTTWVYSGRTLDELVAEGDDDVLAMLSLTDVLVDGAYDASQAGGVVYRGSRNQRILRLSDAIDAEAAGAGAPGKVEIRLEPGGGLVLIGVPEPGFLGQLADGLADRGVRLHAPTWR